MFKTRRSKRAFSLVEVMTATAVFALIAVCAGGIFLSIQRSWQKQKIAAELIRNLRWPAEFMANEIRNSANLVIVSGESLQFELPPGGSSNRIWYWRGDDSAYGTRSVVYRGSGVGLGNANNNRQELANLIVNNPSGNNIFNLNGNLIRIELSAGMDSYNYTLRTQARSRN